MAQGREKEGLTALGNKTQYTWEYAPQLLETFENKHQAMTIG